MSRICERCGMKLYRHEFKSHNCTGVPARTLKKPIGDSSVTGHTSEYTHNKVRNSVKYVSKGSTTGMVHLQSRVSEQSTTSLSEESTKTRKITTSHVSPTPSNPYRHHSNVRKKTNKQPYLGDRNGKSKVTSQSSCVQQVNPEEARPSGSNLKPGKRTREPPESATKEQAVSMSDLENLEGKTCEELTILFCSTRGPSTSSSHLRETPTPGTARASVQTTPTRLADHSTPQESSEQAATSGSRLGTEMFVGEPVESSSRGASADPMLNALLDRKPCKYRCGLCKRDFNSSKEMDEHIDALIEQGVENAMDHNHSLLYSRKGYFVCKICNSRFDRQSDLNSHHTATHPYVCMRCKTVCISEIGLERHMKKAHN